MRTENIIGSNATTTETTEDNRNPRRFATNFGGGCAIADLAGTQFFQVRTQHVPHFGA